MTARSITRLVLIALLSFLLLSACMPAAPAPSQESVAKASSENKSPAPKAEEAAAEAPKAQAVALPQDGKTGIEGEVLEAEMQECDKDAIASSNDAVGYVQNRYSEFCNIDTLYALLGNSFKAEIGTDSVGFIWRNNDKFYALTIEGQPKTWINMIAPDETKLPYTGTFTWDENLQMYLLDGALPPSAAIAESSSGSK